MKPCGVTGEVLDIKGLQSVTFKLNLLEFTHAFLVFALLTDFLENAGAVMTLSVSYRHRQCAASV